MCIGEEPIRPKKTKKFKKIKEFLADKPPRSPAIEVSVERKYGAV